MLNHPLFSCISNHYNYKMSAAKRAIPLFRESIQTRGGGRPGRDTSPLQRAVFTGSALRLQMQRAAGGHARDYSCKKMLETLINGFYGDLYPPIIP